MIRKNVDGVVISLEELGELETLINRSRRKEIIFASRLVLPKAKLPADLRCGKKYEFVKSGIIIYPETKIPFMVQSGRLCENFGEVIVLGTGYSKSNTIGLYKIVSRETDFVEGKAR